MKGSSFAMLPLLYVFLLWKGWLHTTVAEQECQDALGMESGQITDGQITASSEYSPTNASYYGRLHHPETASKAGGWSASTNDVNQWLQIDLADPQIQVTRVATQGRDQHSHRTTKYKLQYSNTSGSFQYYREQGQNNDKTFNGNTDDDTVVYHDLNPPIRARYIRFRIVAWNVHISLRVELFGCLPLQEQENSSGGGKAYAGLCRSLKFTTPIDGYALQGHVIKNIPLLVAMRDTCRDRCTMEGSCVSFNIGPPINDKVLCQLSDSDHTLHPGDLKRKGGFTYKGTQNPCSSNPCFHNGTCLNGYTDKKYLCVCGEGVYGERCEIVPRTCKELYDKNLSTGNKAYRLNLDSGEIPVYCHVTSNLGSCGSGGWTLVMKIDGTKNTFHYDSTYWTNKTAHNVTDGQTGFDAHETKLPTYWVTSFTKICLGMKIGSQLTFIVMNKTASSLFSLIADGQYRPTQKGRNKWKALVGVRATLQTYCDYEGFNPMCSHNLASRARIGIINNDNDLCNTCDSRIGFGTGGYIDDTNTCGNVGPASSDNGGKNTKAMGYILVQ